MEALVTSAPKIRMRSIYEEEKRFALIQFEVADEHGKFHRMLQLSPNEFRKFFFEFHNVVHTLRYVDDAMFHPEKLEE